MVEVLERCTLPETESSPLKLFRRVEDLVGTPPEKLTWIPKMMGLGKGSSL